ncbi:DUF3990 domain-containing protein [Fictibacillus norfolkensis]|uniref:DUF3990 domain-containing protein n=1 Tax=Fictibacillus norfolkensis TaxID=2762233 RepID=A0ABR8SQR2_9BACL|nr:DUF3990 domain-containing protein [Fictibacillus norfolkensis]MBD7965444.1 DUF3990 domain-containing protein [Fictibacillus norfolkensis]
MLSYDGYRTVYHGTTLFAAKLIQQNGIWIEAQRLRTDFGQGFYVTFSRSQAKSWSYFRAKNKQLSPRILDLLNLSESDYLNHPDTRIPAYLVFSLDLHTLHRLQGMIFPLPHDEKWSFNKDAWKEFVKNSRKGIKHDYDFVYGPVWSGHFNSTGEIKASPFKEQLSFHNEKALHCLSSPMIIKLPPKKWISSPEHTNHDQDVFLSDIAKNLMKISTMKEKQALQFIHKYLMAHSFSNIHTHETALYWAFAIFYQSKRIWIDEYERCLDSIIQL